MKTIFRLAIAPACVLILSTARAQDATPQADAAPSSQITGVKLPANALRLRPQSTPADVERALSLMIEASKSKKGRSEVLPWSGAGYAKSKARGIMGQISSALKGAGWRYELAQTDINTGEAVLVRATQDKPARRAVSGYWLASDQALFLAWAEALAPKTEAPTKVEAPAAKGDAKMNAALGEAIEAKDAAKVAELLEQGADANSRATGGQTCLARAITSQVPEITAALLEAGADPEMSGIPSGETPLFMAALMGQDEMVTQLLGKGADINRAVPGSGLTALHGAVYGSYPDTARQLLKAGADPKARDKGGKTARQIAEQADKAELAELLRQAEEGAPE